MSKDPRVVHVLCLNLAGGCRVPRAGYGAGQTMRSSLIRGLGILMLITTVSATPARAEGPGPDVKLLDGPKDTFKSPDKTLVIEQYSRDGGDEGFTYQFWVFDKDHI